MEVKQSLYRQGLGELEKGYGIMDSVARLFGDKISHEDIERLCREFVEGKSSSEMSEILTDVFVESLKYIYNK